MAIDETSTKTAAGGITVYLMEELTDARLRCEQLKRYVGDGVKLIEQSPHRDHFFEVAGHLLHGIPESLFKLDKALSATALAASKLDYDELAQSLKPEKVEELERVLEDSRIRYVTRRSGDPQMTPKDTAQAIRAMATELETTGRFPIQAATELVAILREDQPIFRLASMPTELPPVVLSVMADAIENGTLRNRARLAAMLDTAITQALGGQKMQALLQSAGSRQEVMDGFKKENPALTDEQLKEIADQWEKNKDVVKDKTAARGDGDPIWDVRGGVQIALDQARDLSKIDMSNWPPRVRKALQDGLTALHHADEFFTRAAKELDTSPVKVAGAGEEFQKVNPAITDEQVAVINEMHDKHKDVIKDKHREAAASYAELAGMLHKQMWDWQVIWLKKIEPLARKLQDAMQASHDPEKAKLDKAIEMCIRGKELLALVSGDASSQRHASGDIVAYTPELPELFSTLGLELGGYAEDIETKAAHFWKLWKASEGQQQTKLTQEVRRIVPKILDIVSSMRQQQRIIATTMSMQWAPMRTAAEADKDSKFTEGEPADPTVNMTPEQKAEWEKQNKEHRDEFKTQ